MAGWRGGRATVIALSCGRHLLPKSSSSLCSCSFQKSPFGAGRGKNVKEQSLTLSPGVRPLAACSCCITSQKLQLRPRDHCMQASAALASDTDPGLHPQEQRSGSKSRPPLLLTLRLHAQLKHPNFDHARNSTNCAPCRQRFLNRCSWATGENALSSSRIGILTLACPPRGESSDPKVQISS